MMTLKPRMSSTSQARAVLATQAIKAASAEEPQPLASYPMEAHHSRFQDHHHFPPHLQE